MNDAIRRLLWYAIEPIGSITCARRGHAYGQPEHRWPELGEGGRIKQCVRCMHITYADEAKALAEHRVPAKVPAKKNAA